MFLNSLSLKISLARVSWAKTGSSIANRVTNNQQSYILGKHEIIKHTISIRMESQSYKPHRSDRISTDVSASKSSNILLKKIQ